MAKAVVLSQRDRMILNQLYRKVGTLLNQNQTRNPSQLPESHQAPEMYVAKTRSGGIPAMVGNVPGSAVCDIYQIIGIDPANVRPCGRGQRVYNLSPGDIEPDLFITISRTKFGPWIAGVAASGGATARWGRAQTRQGYFKKVKISVWNSGPPKDNAFDVTAGVISDPLEEIDCITTYPTLVGVPGAIIPLSSFAMGEEVPPFEFRPFITHFYVHADEDWTSGSGVSVTLAGSQGTEESPQTFSAIAPQISGIGMGGVGGYVFGVYGQGADWQFMPLGCVGTPGTGSGT